MTERRFPILASRSGIAFMVAHMTLSGGMCEECGFGTRVTSKNWAKCKRCGHRNRRRTDDEVRAILDASEDA